MPPTPILLYHSVDDDPPDWLAPYTVTPDTFARQLDALTASGRAPVTALQIADALNGGPRLPEHAVAVTFDDGYLDFRRNALPELAARAIPATLFATTGALVPHGRSLLPDAAMLTLAEIRRLDAIGIHIGAHTHLHPQLDTLTESAARWELQHSKEILEQTLGHEVTLAAYPHGYSSRRVRELTRQAGYRAAFAVRNALSPDDDDPYRIARLTVKADTPPERFDAWLGATGAPIAPRGERALTIAWRCYRRARARLPRPPATTESR
jgi:peptidoglycan/xylan/chitin deacetylase (PgdA/CDA1 family)